MSKKIRQLREKSHEPNLLTKIVEIISEHPVWEEVGKIIEL